MKRINVFGLALTLVLGCWVGSTSAAPLQAASALLVPYYEVGGNLATLIGVQHVGDPEPGKSSVIDVFVHNGDDGEVVMTSSICLDGDEFGFVALQSPQPTARDTNQGVYFSVAEDGIDSTGFVTLAYGAATSDCGRSGDAAGSARNVMVAWAILQDVGDGFFATEIPVAEVGWGATVGAVAARAEKKPQDALCYLTATPAGAVDELNDAGNGCNTPTAHTFVAAGEAYCYPNTDPNRANVDISRGANPVQLNAAKNGCNDPFTHTFVPRNTTLPEIEGVAAASGTDFTCALAAACPGLALNTAEIGARFDVTGFNGSVSNIYVWLDTAPPDGRDAEITVVCEDGEMDTRTIATDDYVNVINPARMGCSGRGVVQLTLENRSRQVDFCYASTDMNQTAVADALDDLNNRCHSFRRAKNSDQDDLTAGDAYFCYNPNNIAGNTPAIEDRVTAAEITNPNSSTPNVVTGCTSYRYVADVTADAPDGFIFSHIKQANDHFRTNFPGYIK